MKSQKEEVIEYIKSKGSITSYEAYQKLGITQLGARLDELKKEGFIFFTEWVTKRKNGKTKSFKKYKLVEDIK